MTIPISIIGLLVAVIGLIRDIFRWLNRVVPKLNPKDVAEAEAHKARKASATGDAKDVNARMERHRLRKGLALACMAAVLMGGCRSSRETPAAQEAVRTVPDVVVVSASRWQHPITNAVGVVGWFVPAAVHIEYVEAVELLEYYKAQLSAERKKK